MQSKRKARLGLLPLVLLIGMVFVATAHERPIVFVSIPPQAWLVKALAGESADVRLLLPAGANPHLYEPSAHQLRQLSDAQLFLPMGLPFERPLRKRLTAINPKLWVSPMDAGILKHGANCHENPDAHADGHLDGHANCQAEGDPHIWLSPDKMCAMASNTVRALEQILPPSDRAQLGTAFAKTCATLHETDAEVRAVLKAAPVKTWVTYHASWHYFAEAYGLKLLVIEQDGKTPSARHFAEVIRLAQAAGVQAVFAEPQYDRKSAQILAAQIGARVELADPLQEDWPILMRHAAKAIAGQSCVTTQERR